MVVYKRATESSELNQILALQKKNATNAISSEEKEQEGFITVSHTYEILKKMNDACPHVIAKDGDLVVGYALVMLKEFRDEIAVLSAMFETASELWGAKNYVAMGQICIAKEYRRQGLFREMYAYYKEELQHEYDCLLTEVATENARSLNAHLNVGFELIKTQITNGTSWELICWNWE